MGNAVLSPVKASVIFKPRTCIRELRWSRSWRVAIFGLQGIDTLFTELNPNWLKSIPNPNQILVYIIHHFNSIDYLFLYKLHILSRISPRFPLCIPDLVIKKKQQQFLPCFVPATYRDSQIVVCNICFHLNTKHILPSHFLCTLLSTIVKNLFLSGGTSCPPNTPEKWFLKCICAHTPIHPHFTRGWKMMLA